MVTPEEYAHVETTLKGTVQHIEERATMVRHSKLSVEKGDGHKDAVLCVINGFTDTAERRPTVYKRPYHITSPHRIRCGIDKRYV
jgi:hypothetical protein